MILSQGSGQEGGLTMTGGVTRDPAHCNRLVKTVRMTCGLERVKNLPDLANFGQVQDQALGQAWVHRPPPPRTDCFAILAPLSRYYMYKHYKVYDWARYQGEHGSFSTFNGEPTTNFCAEIPLETIVSGSHIRYIANIFVYLLY